MTVDTELYTWIRDWRVEAKPLEDIRSRVRRGTRRQWFQAAANLLVGAAFIVLATEAVRRQPTHDVFVWAAAMCFFTVAAVVGCVLLWRGTWRPASETTLDFVELSIKRCRANLGAVRFALYLLASEVLFVLAWAGLSGDVWRRAPLVSLVAACYALCCLWVRERNERELKELSAFRESLGGV